MYRRILIVDNIDGPVPVHPGRIGGGGNAGHLVKLTAEIVDALITQPLGDLTHIQIGAEHMAHRLPMGMIFVPSKGGLSHCGEEWTDPDYLDRGADILYRTLLRLDQEA